MATRLLLTQASL